MEEVKLNQKTVLAYLKRQTEPCSASEIRFMLDASHGIVYSPSRVTSVLEALERKGQAQRAAFGYWEYKRVGY